jgi:hypothetical protein
VGPAAVVGEKKMSSSTYGLNQSFLQYCYHRAVGLSEWVPFREPQ